MSSLCWQWTDSVLTQCPGEVELGPGCLYGEESVGEPGEEGGVADKVGVHVVRYGQRASHSEEEQHAATADQQLLTHSGLQGDMRETYITNRQGEKWTIGK